MLKTCVDCNKDFFTHSSFSKYCLLCKEIRLSRVCVICNTDFKVSKIRSTKQTCSNKECIKKLISSKYSDERKHQSSLRLAKRNTEYYNSLSDEEKHQYSNKMRIIRYNQIKNETPEQKHKRIQKEKHTKANFTKQKKTQISNKIKDSLKKRYTEMSKDEYNTLLQNRFKHLENTQDFNREFILLNFANKDGVILYEDRIKIKEYYNMKSSLASLQQVINKKFNIKFIKHSNVSFKELELRNILNEYLSNYKVIYNTRKIIKPYELDIFYPELNLAIEYNGLYYHNKENPIKENLKTHLCLIQGITLIHVWEYEEDKGILEILKFLENLRTF